MHLIEKEQLGNAEMVSIWPGEVGTVLHRIISVVRFPGGAPTLLTKAPAMIELRRCPKSVKLVGRSAIFALPRR